MSAVTATPTLCTKSPSELGAVSIKSPSVVSLTLDLPVLIYHFEEFTNI